MGAGGSLGAGGGIVLWVEGIPGEATAPATADRPEVTGAILPVAACHRLWYSYDAGSGQVTGVQEHSPYTLVSRVGPEMPGLVQALLDGSPISQATVFFDGLDALNARTTTAKSGFRLKHNLQHLVAS